MVLQRYALRFTISDAILDSLKLPRPTSKPKTDPNQLDEEHKPISPINDSEMSNHLQKEPVVTPAQGHEDTAEPETSVSVSPSSPTPDSPHSTVTNSENMPSLLLELNEPQSNPTDSPTTQQTKKITTDAHPPAKQAPPQIAHVQPHTTQPVPTLPSPPSVPPRPVPLLAAKPYCQPRTSQSGHKPVKVRAPHQSVTLMCNHHDFLLSDGSCL